MKNLGKSTQFACVVVGVFLFAGLLIGLYSANKHAEASGKKSEASTEIMFPTVVSSLEESTVDITKEETTTEEYSSYNCCCCCECENCTGECCESTTCTTEETTVEETEEEVEESQPSYEETEEETTVAPTTKAPTTQAPTTQASTTQAPTTQGRKIVGISATISKTTWDVGKGLDPSYIVVKANYNDGTSHSVSNWSIKEAYQYLPVGTHTLTILWKEFSCTIKVTLVGRETQEVGTDGVDLTAGVIDASKWEETLEENTEMSEPDVEEPEVVVETTTMSPEETFPPLDEVEETTKAADKPSVSIGTPPATTVASTTAAPTAAPTTQATTAEVGTPLATTVAETTTEEVVTFPDDYWDFGF